MDNKEQSQINILYMQCNQEQSWQISNFKVSDKVENNLLLLFGQRDANLKYSKY